MEIEKSASINRNSCKSHRPTFAVVNLSAIQSNIRWMKVQLQEGQQLYAIVKANAYGHGAVEVAKAAQAVGVDGFAVATVDEAIELRQNGIDQLPILVLGLTNPRGIEEILLYDITVTVSDTAFFEQAYQQLVETDNTDLLNKRLLHIHLALDTGMGRIGLQTKEEVVQFTTAIRSYPWVDWQGVFTHFSTAGGGSEAYIEQQWQNWMELLKEVPESVELRHYANSAMGMWYTDHQSSDIIRYGIAMYGIDPKDNVYPDSPLTPALQLVSEIVYVKKVVRGRSISYGATYTTQGDEWIGTVPIGYGDGWLRKYNVMDVLVDGIRCPVVGTINMDQMMIRLPKYYPVGTTVTLIGQSGYETNHVSLLAKQVDTIGYEILSNIGSRVQRIYTNN